MAPLIAPPTTLRWSKRVLRFITPARTSYALFHQRPVWYVHVGGPGTAWQGTGECAPLDGLSVESSEHIEPMLEKMHRNPRPFLEDPAATLAPYPSLRFALETALRHYGARGSDILFPSSFTGKSSAIPINGLVWMGDAVFMKEQINRHLTAGYTCIKLKIGGIDFEEELDLLRYIRSHYARQDLEIRLDANGAFPTDKAGGMLGVLEPFGIHSIEQPVRPGNIEILARLCEKSPVPIALDEELIPSVFQNTWKELLDQVKPAYLVLKPSLLGGFAVCEEIIAVARRNATGYWITSALESNVGLNWIAQWAAVNGVPGTIQGLGTGLLYSNNTDSSLRLSRGKLFYDGKQ